ncbi:MAG: hypothetical protein WCO23_02870 [bacterium]
MRCPRPVPNFRISVCWTALHGGAIGMPPIYPHRPEREDEE